MDGGLASELEGPGLGLQDELWSARCLVSAPHLIRKVSHVLLLRDKKPEAGQFPGR